MTVAKDLVSMMEMQGAASSDKEGESKLKKCLIIEILLNHNGLFI